MNVWLAALGILLLVVGVVDVLWTVLWVDEGAGPLTARLTTGVWWLFRRLVPERRHRILSFHGPFVLVLSLAVWLGLIWFGWTFLFAADVDALVVPASGEHPDFAGRFYFVGYTLFTMGNGDFSPTSDFWQVATGLCTANGMTVVTLIISYVISVISAVVAKRSLASQISGLGSSAEEIVIEMWDGEQFTVPANVLMPLSSQISDVSEQHLAYPILHYYHPASPNKSTPTTMTILDDALTLMAFGVRQDKRPPDIVLQSTRNSTGSYVDALDRVWVEPADESPTRPDLDRLREAGIPVVDDEEFDEALDSLGQRRHLLEGILQKAESERPPLGESP